VKLATVDNKRRVVLPRQVEPHSSVSIEEVDENTFIIRCQPQEARFKQVLIPVIDHLPSDKAWEKTEAKIGRHIAKRLPLPERD
jgi:hypothetical protein